jgi:hypothetical protein
MFEAADYPLLNATWTIFIFFAWVLWFWLLIQVFADVFRRHDLSGWGKTGWTVFVIVVPLLGALIYLIAQGKGMEERRQRDSEAAATAFYAEHPPPASSDTTAGQIAHAKQLLDEGAINEAEYNALKKKAMAA